MYIGCCCCYFFSAVAAKGALLPTLAVTLSNGNLWSWAERDGRCPLRAKLTEYAALAFTFSMSVCRRRFVNNSTLWNVFAAAAAVAVVNWDHFVGSINTQQCYLQQQQLTSFTWFTFISLFFFIFFVCKSWCATFGSPVVGWKFTK